jgi:AP-3 complex subunit delta-1
LLTTNLFKKEFGTNSPSSQYDIGLAVNCLANIATKELSRDCIGDLVLLMNHSRPYVRKKAILAMYKLYVKFPQGLRLTFDRLKEKLDDPESAVVSTAVNVICELANKNPKNYLAMAPKFFRLLTTSANNWMLIKVVKLLGSLVSEEPRLARKLLEPLATIIENTGAKSLEYECIYTLTEALPYSRREDGSEAKNAQVVIKLCSDHLRKFIEESDQNLKYLGLVGLCNLMRSSPRSVVEHRDIILSCLNDDDITIRSKALELLAGIVSKKSLVDLVQHLLQVKASL